MPLGNSMSFGQNEIQETTPGVIKEVKLRSTYRYFRVFRTKELIFDYPAILHISLKANKAPIEKGSIKLEFRHSSEGSGKSIATAHGPGPFKEEIEILQLKPYESRQIETRTRSINYIPRVLNPATLSKDYVVPLVQEVASQFLSESSTSGERPAGPLPIGGRAPASVPDRNGFARVIGSKEESTILNPKWRQPVEKNAEQGHAVDGH